MGLVKVIDPFSPDYMQKRNSSRNYSSDAKQREVVGILRNQGFKHYTKKGESYIKCVKPGFENQPFYVSKSGNCRVGDKAGFLIRYDDFMIAHSN